ncbi:MAG: DUF2073 domain-containing protein [Halobacteria archaeon]|nr:DUF2073 domain-containing protein [Halobacteria archaeon]
MPELETDSDGVPIDMISSERMEGMASIEKVNLILDSVREGKIVILESGLSPDEESKLIEVTMSEISPDGFSGIEIESYPKQEASQGILGKILGNKPSKLTVIGPANQIQTLHKDSDLITALVSGG